MVSKPDSSAFSGSPGRISFRCGHGQRRGEGSVFRAAVIPVVLHGPVTEAVFDPHRSGLAVNRKELRAAPRAGGHDRVEAAALPGDFGRRRRPLLRPVGRQRPHSVKIGDPDRARPLRKGEAQGISGSPSRIPACAAASAATERLEGRCRRAAAASFPPCCATGIPQAPPASGVSPRHGRE